MNCKAQTGTPANHVWKFMDTVIENYCIIKVLRCSLCNQIGQIIDGKFVYSEPEKEKQHDR